MLGSEGLPRTVIRRSRADWPVLAAAWLLVLCAIALVAAATMYNDAVAAGGLHRAIRDAPPAETAVVARATVPLRRLPEVDALVIPRLATALGETGGQVDRVFRRASLILPGVDLGAGAHGTVLGSYPTIADHAALVDGRWPVAGHDPVETVLSTGAEASLGRRIGDRVQVSDALDATQTVDVVVVGTYEPHRADPYWLGDPLELDGERTTTTFIEQGPFVVAPGDLVARMGRTLQTEWRSLPAIDRLTLDATDDLATRSEAVRAALPAAARAGGIDITVTTNLPAVLTRASAASVVSRSSVTLLMIQFGVLGVYAVILVAGMIVERRRPEAALLRSRGATSGHLIAMGLVEGLVIAIPAAIVAPWLALAVVRLVGATGPLGDAAILSSASVDGPVIVATVVAALLSVLVFTLPTITSSRGLSGVRASMGRSSDRTLAQRLGIDIVLVVLAAIGLWQLRLYGSPLTRDLRGSLGLDPLLMAAPAIGLLAGAVLVTRLIPRAAELGERALATRPDLVPPLGAHQVARRPLRYTRSALLLLLAAALGTLAVTHSATWARSQADQAAYEAGADVRVLTSPYQPLPAWAGGAAIRAIPGVRTAMPVDRGTFDLGRTIRSGQLLGIDPGLAPVVVGRPADERTSLPADLASALAPAPTDTAIARIDGQPVRLAVTVHTDLQALAVDESGELVPSTDGDAQGRISVAAWVLDGDGRIQRLDASDVVGLHEAAHPVDMALTGAPGAPQAALQGPLALVGLELGLDGLAGGALTGTLDVTEVAASDSPTGTFTPLDLAAARGTWTWRRASTDGNDVTAGLGDAAVRLAKEDPVFVGPQAPSTVVRLVPSAEPAPLPAIASEAFLAASGTRIGDMVTVDSAGRSVPLRLTGSSTYLPSLDPAIPWLAVDGAALQRLIWATTAATDPPDEWWLAADPGASEGITAAVEREPLSATTVLVRDDVARSLASDPLALGIVGALALGSLAALAFAAIGFVFNATVSTSERTGEFALLRALGMSTRQLTWWLTAEQGLLLLVGLVAGTAIGLLLAWLVLPYATFTLSGEPAVPPPVVVVPWDQLIPLYLVAVGLLGVTALIVRRQLPRIRVSGVLRARDE